MTVPSIQFQIRNVYGEEKAYPVGFLAENFALIAGTKTLTRHTMAHILRMGFELAEIDRHGNVSRTFRADTVQHLPMVA